jgi:Holliday junction resolvasome RuvABC ATP-dependent DNA helicase subunit
MSSLSCDSIGPKHGSRVTITGAVYDVAEWTTATATATAGPVISPSTIDVVISWRTNGNYATLAIPEFTFVGANVTLAFAAVPGLPAPLETTRFPVVQTLVSLSYEVGCIIVGTDRTITFYYNIVDTGAANYSNNSPFGVFPVVFEYKIA